MILYLVTVEGYYDGYGSSTYSVGIFDSMDKVKKVIEETAIKISTFFPELENSVDDIINEYFEITEFGLNVVYPPVKTTSKYAYEIHTDKYLGGYIE